jgi:shikimate dehydrogenase
MTGAIALIGDPVSNSVSPAMHRAAFNATGLDFTYEAIAVGRADLPEALGRLRSTHVGLNVTIPLKEAVIPLLDGVSPEAARAGSVNTVVFGDEAVGYSTDGAGFVAALRRAGVTRVDRALILGTGGAARAVAAALLDEGTNVTVSGRNVEAGRRAAADLGVTFLDTSHDVGAALADTDLLVNATPVGAGSDDSPVPAELIPSGIVVFDLVYRPRMTRLLGQAEAAGSLPVHGVDMLIEQGARSFELWTRRPAPVEAMRRAAYAALGDALPAVSEAR